MNRPGGWLAGIALAAALAGPAAAQSGATAPAVQSATPAAKPTTKPAAKPTTKPAARAPARDRAMDRLELEATQITGSRELPKVMVVVPWKKSDIGDLVGKPINSLVDEALQPVDREVFRREVDYYGALAPDRPAAPPAGQPATVATPEAPAR